MGRFEEGADKLRHSFEGGQLRFDFIAQVFSFA